MAHRWQIGGWIKYVRKKRFMKMPWVTTTDILKILPGSLSLRKVNKCIRSFSASSSSVWIQPWSRSCVSGTALVGWGAIGVASVSYHASE